MEELNENTEAALAMLEDLPEDKKQGRH